MIAAAHQQNGGIALTVIFEETFSPTFIFTDSLITYMSVTYKRIGAKEFVKKKTWSYLSLIQPILLVQ